MALLRKKARTAGVSDPAKLLIVEHEKVERIFAELTKAKSANTRAGLVAQLDAELTAHADKEEQILYPFIRANVPKGIGMINEAKHEHGLVRQTLGDLSSMDPGDDRLPAVVARLERMVGDHVRKEERELFPALDKATSMEEQAELRSDLEAAKFAPPARSATKKASAKKNAPARKAPAKKKAPAKRAPAKKAPAKKAPAKRAPVKKKAPAKKAPAKKKAPTRKAPARKKAAVRKRAATRR